MASTPEGQTKRKIDRALAEKKAYWHKPVQNGLGAPALDYHVCHFGFYAAIEAKAPGKKPTPRQLNTMSAVIKAGGSVFLIDRHDGADMAELIWWLASPKMNFVSTNAELLLKIDLLQDQLRTDNESRND